MGPEEEKQWEAQCAWQNQFLALGEKERGEQIKYGKVNRVRWGQLGSDVEGLTWHTRKCTASTVDNRDRAQLGVFKHRDCTIRYGFGAIYTLTKAPENGLQGE